MADDEYRDVYNSDFYNSLDELDIILAEANDEGVMPTAGQPSPKRTCDGSTPSTPAISTDADMRNLSLSKTPYPQGEF